MQLTPHFSLEEMTVTNHRSIDNSLDPDNPAHAPIIEHLRTTAIGLELVRQKLGGTRIMVTSGFRCPALNAAVGSKPTSAHVVGYAVDFIVPDYGSPFVIAGQLAQVGGIAWDQLIYEHPMHSQWVHLSFAPRMRNEILTISPEGTASGIVPPYPQD